MGLWRVGLRYARDLVLTTMRVIDCVGAVYRLGKNVARKVNETRVQGSGAWNDKLTCRNLDPESATVKHNRLPRKDDRRERSNSAC